MIIGLKVLVNMYCLWNAYFWGVCTKIWL